MKCENCGREEVHFHYTSNINGNITEKHLCAECAGKLGYAGRGPEQPEQTFEEIFAELFGFYPNKRMFSGYGLVVPTFIIPTVVMPVSTNEPETDGGKDVKSVVDEAMKKRRELNVLREKMRQAVESEDFEQAAELRDAVKALENG